ncbi:MAG: EamA family transporter [Proteobacteria bacterium]|nr:MAG: EamA family transporter [Pseudomonadota bacterium]
MKNTYLLGISCALLASLIWSSSFIALKIAIASMNPMSIVFFRMLLASLMFAFFYKRFKGLHVNKEDLKWIIFMVVCEPGLYFVFEISALEFTSASQAGVIVSTMPLLTAIGAGIFLKEEVTKQLIFGSLLAMAGAIWLSLSASANDYAPNPLLGNTLEALAMVCAAGYTLSLKHLSKKFSALFLTAVQAFGGALFFLPLSLWEFGVRGFSVGYDSFLAVLYLGIVVTMGGYGLFNYALTLAPASKISNVINLIPAFTIILAYFILDDVLNQTQIFAAGVIFLGVFISQSIKLKRH